MSFSPEDRRVLLLRAAVWVAVALIAVADSLVVRNLSLGFVYLLPLGFAAVLYSPRIAFFLVLACVVLREAFGPYDRSGWSLVVRTVVFLAIASLMLVVIRLVLQRRELFRTIRQHRDELEREIQLAAEVQQRLLPRAHARAHGFEIAGRMVPARQVTGDFYDYLELPEGQVGFVIADVSGKGLPAALLMPTVQAVLRLTAAELLRPEAVLKNLNRTIYEVTDESRYVALFYGRLLRGQGRFEYSNAGHHPPLLFRAASQEPEWLERGGPVLGLLPQAAYEAHTAELRPGDLLVLYTDGLVEASNPGGEEYSRQRLLRTLAGQTGKTAEEVVEALHQSVRRFRQSPRVEDDMTVIVVRVLDRI